MTRHLMAIFVFILLPVSFWGSVFYYFVSPDLGKAVMIVMTIVGIDTCVKGARNLYKCRRFQKMKPSL